MTVIWIAIIAAGAALDRISKVLASHFLKSVNTVPIIENVFHLTYVENDGAAFSILRGQRWLLVVVTCIGIAAILYAILFGRIKSKTLLWALSLIAAGGIGNLIDRLFHHGRVIDYFDFRLINFPVFNVADVLVTAGAVLLFVYILFFFDKGEKPAQGGAADEA
ncbi:signal peptidase II [Feifania hominis]|uniref:Lipoprotein signal peptidase n=1 Tax=Feifania hominis TaxID=2763660 RepID=A0A926HQX4_9FIRM|nr:signal peptidase II [Feifania hominis]MBC8536822.1 signal peptidase II [Feifania hominis]